LGSDHEARRIIEEAASRRWPQCLDDPVSVRALPYAEAMIERRVAGEPLQYVLGRWAFRRLDLLVDSRVLIPRPETEQVVEVALSELKGLEGTATQTPDRVPDRGPDRGPDRVMVDLGTGSGAIALSLAAETDHGTVWATDISREALDVARANLAGLGGLAATRVRLVQGPWWDALPADLRGKVSLAVANPPYVPSPAMATLPPEVARWEPAVALDGGPDGLDPVRAILKDASEWLARPGLVVLEIGEGQAEQAGQLARAAGLDRVAVHADVAGRLRALVAVKGS
jgi:release factor glutamine methyltransferase